jgi:nifR3 family TIM-barrel protein
MKNFWTKLKKPFFCLAPMADVTDYPFRKIITKYGKPDVLWTEFVSADGLSNSKGKKKLIINLKFSKKEKPIVAQIFGSNPENIKKASALCDKLGFDGIDINMGCPDRSVEKQNSGAAMMKNPELAKKVIEAARAGAQNSPISVKTRIGYSKNEIDSWIKFLLEQKLSALTVHLRTRKEMSNVPAHWEYMKHIVELRNKISPKTLIIGNGDVINLEDAKNKAKETGCDGVMLGRAIFGNPELFSKKRLEKDIAQNDWCEHSNLPAGKYACLSKDASRKLKILIEHTKLFEKELKNHKNFNVMKKHFKAYVNGFDRAKELRAKLMETKNSKEVEKIIKDFLKFIK